MAEILAFVLASLNKKDDLKDKLFYVPHTILERLKKIKTLSSNESARIKNDKEQKEKEIEDHVRTTGNYSDMFCIGDDSKNIECIDERITDNNSTDDGSTNNGSTYEPVTG